MLKSTLGVLLAVLACAGCGRNFYHYHRTVIGIDIAGNVAGSSPRGHLIIGYSRRLVTALPQEAQDALSGQGGAGDTQLPSTVFCTQVRASLGGVNAFREVLATGAPAEQYAEALTEASAGISEYQYRNFVCPGFEIPAPLADTRTTATTDTVSKTKKGEADPGANNAHSVVAPVSPLPAPGSR